MRRTGSRASDSSVRRAGRLRLALLVPLVAAGGPLACGEADRPRQEVDPADVPADVAPGAQQPSPRPTGRLDAGPPRGVDGTGPAPGAPPPMPDPGPSFPDEPTTEPPLPPGIVESALDLKADPCEDFYRYACGGYVDKTTVPPTGSISILSAANAQSSRILTEIIDAAAAGKPPAGLPLGKEIGDLYATCADEAAIERGLPAIKADLAKLDAVTDAASIGTALGELQAGGTPALLSFGPFVDRREATKVFALAAPGALSLPASAYAGTDERAATLRTALETAVTSVWKALGDAPERAAEKAKALLALETELAKATAPASGSKTLSQAELVAQIPAFPWARLFAALRVSALPKILVSNPAFFERVGPLLGGQPIAAWRAYLAWHRLRALDPALPKAAADAVFGLRVAVSGPTSRSSRRNVCLNLTSSTLPDAIALGFVGRFPGNEKIRAEALAMIKEIEAQLAGNLDALGWMDGATKAKALEKLQKVSNKVAYPDMPSAYKGLVLDRTGFFANLVRARAWRAAQAVAQIGQMTDRASWSMPPWVVNAQYDRLRNEMTFPLAILQPPFFSLEATAPMNYGGIGSIMGHELIHGFDNNGREHDGDGNLANWWTPGADAAFRERSMCIARQFGEFQVADVPVKGDKTLGENIADLGGLKLAFGAMQARRAKNPDMGQGSRYSVEQQFFISYAQHACQKWSPAALAAKLKSDEPHAPWEFRINGSLSNFPSFHEAWKCRPGQKMVRAMRCELW